MKRWLSIGIRALVIAVILVALVLFVMSVQWRETWRAMSGAAPMILVAAAAVNVISVGVRGVRWWIFLRAVGAPSIGLSLRGAFVGAGLNNILIANSGDAARVVFVSRSARVGSDRVLATLALERLLDLVGFVTLLMVAVTFLGLPATLEDARPWALGALIVMIGALVFLVLHPEKADVPAVPGAGLFAQVRAYGGGFFRTLTSVSTAPRLAVGIALSLLIWLLQIATYALTALAAHFPISLSGTIAALLVANVGFALRATPGNVGVFQMMYAMTAAFFGMDRDAATGVALLIQLQQGVPITLIALVFARFPSSAASFAHLGMPPASGKG